MQDSRAGTLTIINQIRAPRIILDNVVWLVIMPSLLSIQTMIYLFYTDEGEDEYPSDTCLKDDSLHSMT